MVESVGIQQKTVGKTLCPEFSCQPPRQIEPIRKGDLRALIDLLKKNDFSPTQPVTSSDITRRDIIEYAFTRQMAYAVDQAATLLLSYDISRDLEELRGKLEQVVLDIDTAPDGLRFTPTQRATFEQALGMLADDLGDFRSHLPAERLDEYVIEHLGDRFKQLSTDSYTCDIHTYPGVVVVRIPYREDYNRIAPKDSQGLYNRILGEGILRGRILVVRGKVPPDKSTEYHEYLHFLNSKFKHLRLVPRKEKQAQAKVVAMTQPFARQLTVLQSEKEEVEEYKYSEMRRHGRASVSVRERIMNLRERIEKYREAKDRAAYFAEAEITTYSHPDVQRAFETLRDELQAYLIGGNELPRSFIADTIGTSFATTLTQTTEGKLFLLELGVLKEILLLATNTDLNPQEIGFLVSGARNVSQAAKFIYLHLMQAPGQNKKTISRHELPIAA